MRKALAALLCLAACGPGSDSNSFPAALANSICHFIYHCCTPADRANDQSTIAFLPLETSLDFADESDCDQKVGASLELQFQIDQASVHDKRMTWNQNAAQACLNARNAASSACDPNAFYATSSGQNAPCQENLFVAGQVAASGACTQDTDCAVVGSTCTPATYDGGGPAPIITGGSCVSPPALGAPCSQTCVPGACCSGASATCVGYVAEGQPCDLFGCGAHPCDPAKDYCATGTGIAATCTALLANGAPCNALYQGGDCASGYCDPNTNACGNQPEPKLELCTGNPDGF